MTTQTVRCSLSGTDMPFLYKDANRAVILPGLDQVGNATYRTENQDWNNPRVLFVENVMPISKGIISVAMGEIVAPMAPGNRTDFNQAIVLRDDQENNTLFVSAKGSNYLLNKLGVWVSSLPFVATKTLITRAYTQGRSFVCYEEQKIFEYNGVTGAMVDRTAAIVFPAGFTMADVRGIGGASNYLLMFTGIEILWSSPNDPLNFNRLLNNGSGYQIPEDLRGQISCILPVAGGAIIYTVRNAVAAVFTNNAATPFRFRGISNSGGVASYEQVAYDADEQFQYIWSSGGFQAVNLQSAASVHPEMADFLTGGVFEYYDWLTKKVVSEVTGSNFAVKLTYVAQRFLVVSYGRSAGFFEYAWILDTTLKRWGKVKIDHTDSFVYPYPNITGDLTIGELVTSIAGLGDTTIAGLSIGVISISPPKRSIAFLKADGSINIVSIDYAKRSQYGVALVGQIQHNRNNYTTLHKVECEGIDQTTPTKLYALCSKNGKTISRVVEYDTYTDPDENYQSFQGRETDVNLTLGIVGAFQLTGLILKVSKHGKV